MERARTTSIKGDPVISIFMTSIHPNFFTRTTPGRKKKTKRWQGTTTEPEGAAATTPLPETILTTVHITMDLLLRAQ